MNGQQLAEQGMERAAEHADAVTPNWQTDAFNALLAVAAKGDPFMVDDARGYLLATGGKDAPDARAWGAIATRAAKAGYIRAHGWGGAQRASGHNGPRRVWVKS